jgi:uncharacterized protein YceK
MNSYRVIVLVFISMISGCASISETFTDKPELSHRKNKIYAGASLDATIVKSCGFNWEERCALTPFAVIDFPFSAIVDTVLLPYTLFSNDVAHIDAKQEDVSKPNAPPP